MSVSFVVDWPDGRTERVQLGSLRQVKGWAPMAREIGLELVPKLYSFLPVDAGNIEQVLGELVTFRSELVHRGPGYEERVGKIDRILPVLERLKGLEGWSASIG